MGEQILIRKRFHWICYSQLFKNNARIGWCHCAPFVLKIFVTVMVYLVELLQMFRVILNPLTMVLLYLDIILLPWWNIFYLCIILLLRWNIPRYHFSTVKWLACSRCSDSRARSKNCRDKQKRERLERKKGALAPTIPSFFFPSFPLRTILTRSRPPSVFYFSLQLFPFYPR